MTTYRHSPAYIKKTFHELCGRLGLPQDQQGALRATEENLTKISAINIAMLELCEPNAIPLFTRSRLLFPGENVSVCELLAAGGIDRAVELLKDAVTARRQMALS